MGLFSQSSRLGSIAAPFLLMAGAQLGGRSAVLIPYLAFGSMSLLAGLLVLVLPETLGVAMPETMQDMAALQSLFAAKPWRQGCGATLAFLFRRRASTAQALPAVQRRAAPAALPAAGTGKDAAPGPPPMSEQEVVVTVRLPSPARDHKQAASGDGEGAAGVDSTNDSSARMS